MRQDADRFRHLPEPIRLEDTVSSVETHAYLPEALDEQREVEWLLRTTG